ncbi:hypothetical protein ACF0H5_008874 [Mactra antiquata]
MIKEIVSVFLLCTVHVHAAPNFANAQQVATVTSHSINEASGICASRTHKDVLYTHNDSGDGHRIFAISATSGARLATIQVNGAGAQDWEDIACGPCAGGSGHCIYIADTGGNAGGDANTIYRIREPSSLHDTGVNLDGTLKFSWDQHDCETVMVDPKGEVYVVSKVGAGHHAKVVHLPSYAWGSHQRVYVNDGVYVSFTASSNSPVGGDISPDGREVLMKTYGHVYYWSVPDGNYYSSLTSYPATLPYHWERQGEGICFSANANGYYTLGEGANSPLWFYRRQ